MNDLISRQATYLALVEKGQASKRYKIGETWELNGKEIREVLGAMPSAQPEQQWIPVSERLPEEGKVVLTQAKFKDDVKMAVSSRIDYNYWTTWGTRDINIIAWMPLPEPYKGEQK